MSFGNYKYQNYMMIISFVFVFFAFFLILSDRANAALTGAPSNTFPDTSIAGEVDTYAVVQIVDAPIKMKARTTTANIYIPNSLLGTTQTVRVLEGCDNIGRDYQGGRGSTDFIVSGSGFDVLVNNDSVCGSGVSNIDIQFTPTLANSFRATEDYQMYRFFANGNGTERSGFRYLNAFRVQALGGGALVGLSDLAVACDDVTYPWSCPSPRPANLNLPSDSFVYSSFYGGSTAAGQNYYGQEITILPCSNGATRSGGYISLYDLDANDATLAQDIRIRLYKDGEQQTLIRPDGVRVNEINHLSTVLWGFAYPGFSGNEDGYMDLPPDAANASLGRFDPGSTYKFEIVGLSKDNAIQMLTSLSPCPPANTLDNVTCSISGPIIISSTATTVEVPVRINAVSGSAVPAGSRTNGLHLGVTSAGTPLNWNATGSPNPPPDTQTRYIARPDGAVGLSHYTEGQYNRYWINNSITENSSTDVTISVTISQIDQDLVVRLLDRAGGRWLNNYCSVKINRNNAPTISINGSPGCSNFVGNYTDSDGDMLSIYLLVDGNRVVNSAGVNVDAFNLTNQPSSSSNTPYSFSTSSWRDFNTRNFEVVISDGLDTVRTGNQSVGPCLSISCGGASINTVGSNALEVNRPFNVTTNFIIRNSSGVETTMGSRGVQVTYGAVASTNPSSGTPTNTVVNQTINSSTNNPINHSFLGFVAGPEPSEFDINYSIINASNSRVNIDCEEEDEFNSANLPYSQFFNGSVIAGYGMKTSNGTCSTNSSSVRGYNGFSLDVSTDIIGSGSQAAVFALGAVTGFRSATTETARNGLPWLRTFANVSGAPRDINVYGGSFNSSLCAENWFDEMGRIEASTAPGLINPAVAQRNGPQVDLSAVRGTIKYNNPQIRVGASVPLEGSRKIFAEGDVIIGYDFNNGTVPSTSLVYSTENWNSVTDIPSLVIVARGNIYIDDAITRLDGIFVAGGTVFTCSQTYGALPADNQSINDYSPVIYRLGQTCNTNSLTINGAIISNNIRLWRTGGTLSRAFNSTGTEVNSTGYQGYVEGLTGAETFRLTPDMFIAPRLGEPPANGLQGRKLLDSIISLPPVF